MLMESKTDLLVKRPCRVMAVYFLSYIVDFIIMSDIMQSTCRVMAVYFLSYIVDFIIMSDNYAIYIGLGIFLVSPSPTPYHPTFHHSLLPVTSTILEVHYSIVKLEYQLLTSYCHWQ
jgi:hypothetical protein